MRGGLLLMIGQEYIKICWIQITFQMVIMIMLMLWVWYGNICVNGPFIMQIATQHSTNELMLRPIFWIQLELLQTNTQRRQRLKPIV